MHGTGRCLAALAVALGSALLLAACGGGGSGGGNAAPTAQTGAGAQQPAPARTLTQTDVNRLRAADPAKNLDSAAGAARATPRFGSVTQSTNVDSNGVTTDRASAAFNGTRMTVRVTRADSSVLTIDTADAVVEVGPRADTEYRIPGAARSERGWGTLNVSGSAATLGFLGVTSANGSSDDWLALGGWLHIAGRNLLSSAPTVTSVDMGTFVDGPELRSHPTTLPVTGTARYEGYAGGLYAARYGNGFGSVAPGTEVFGAFEAVATLTADFADNSISGCVGCKGDMSLSGIFKDGATGETRSFTDVPGDTQLRLGKAQIAQDGTFRVRDVTSSLGATEARIGVAEQEGSWGGKFSNVSVATDEPRLVAGTFGGELTLNDGSQSAYVGAFGAGKQ